jgi:D-alanyl-D-alanine carboxypeptidase-like protein
MIRRVAAIGGLVLAFGATAVIAVAIWPERAGNRDIQSTTSSGRLSTSGGTGADLTKLLPPGDPGIALQPVTGPLSLHYRFKHPPVAGILFDVKSGEVLWQRNPGLQHPIASLTKMMTALMVTRSDPPHTRVFVSAKAAHTPGSATGLLPRGREVPLEPLLQALIMISANDEPAGWCDGPLLHALLHPQRAAGSRQLLVPS